MSLNDGIIGEANVEIGGYPFHGRDITPEESWPRREKKRTNIMSGTQVITKGAFIPHKYSFTANVLVPEDKPGTYDTIFQSIQNNVSRVVCPEMGDPFDAEVIIKRSRETPRWLKVEVSIEEIPGTNSSVTDNNDSSSTVSKDVS